MTTEQRIRKLEKRIAELESMLVQYDSVERMAFASFWRTHPKAAEDAHNVWRMAEGTYLVPPSMREKSQPRVKPDPQP